MHFIKLLNESSNQLYKEIVEEIENSSGLYSVNFILNKKLFCDMIDSLSEMETNPNKKWLQAIETAVNVVRADVNNCTIKNMENCTVDVKENPIIPDSLNLSYINIFNYSIINNYHEYFEDTVQSYKSVTLIFQQTSFSKNKTKFFNENDKITENISLCPKRLKLGNIRYKYYCIEQCPVLFLNDKYRLLLHFSNDTINIPFHPIKSFINQQIIIHMIKTSNVKSMTANQELSDINEKCYNFEIYIFNILNNFINPQIIFHKNETSKAKTIIANQQLSDINEICYTFEIYIFDILYSFINPQLIFYKNKTSIVKTRTTDQQLSDINEMCYTFEIYIFDILCSLINPQIIFHKNKTSIVKTRTNDQQLSDINEMCYTFETYNFDILNSSIYLQKTFYKNNISKVETMTANQQLFDITEKCHNFEINSFDINSFTNSQIIFHKNETSIVKTRTSDQQLFDINEECQDSKICINDAKFSLIPYLNLLKPKTKKLWTNKKHLFTMSYFKTFPSDIQLILINRNLTSVTSDDQIGNIYSTFSYILKPKGQSPSEQNGEYLNWICEKNKIIQFEEFINWIMTVICSQIIELSIQLLNYEKYPKEYPTGSLYRLLEAKLKLQANNNNNNECNVGEIILYCEKSSRRNVTNKIDKITENISLCSKQLKLGKFRYVYYCIEQCQIFLNKKYGSLHFSENTIDVHFHLIISLINQPKILYKNKTSNVKSMTVNQGLHDVNEKCNNFEVHVFNTLTSFISSQINKNETSNVESMTTIQQLSAIYEDYYNFEVCIFDIVKSCINQQIIFYKNETQMKVTSMAIIQQLSDINEMCYKNKIYKFNLLNTFISPQIILHKSKIRKVKIMSSIQQFYGKNEKCYNFDIAILNVNLSLYPCLNMLKSKTKKLWTNKKQLFTMSYFKTFSSDIQLSLINQNLASITADDQIGCINSTFSYILKPKGQSPSKQNFEYLNWISEKNNNLLQIEEFIHWITTVTCSQIIEISIQILHYKKLYTSAKNYPTSSLYRLLEARLKSQANNNNSNNDEHRGDEIALCCDKLYKKNAINKNMSYINNLLYYLEETLSYWKDEIEDFENLLPFLIKIFNHIKTFLVNISNTLKLDNLLKIIEDYELDLNLINSSNVDPLVCVLTFRSMLHNVNEFGRAIEMQRLVSIEIRHYLYTIYLAYKHKQLMEEENTCDVVQVEVSSTPRVGRMLNPFTERRLKMLERKTKCQLQLMDKKASERQNTLISIVLNNNRIVDTEYRLNSIITLLAKSLGVPILRIKRINKLTENVGSTRRRLHWTEFKYI